jgi:hypothetical protein
MRRLLFAEGEEVKGKPWTVEDEQKLANLVKEKKPLDVIAEALGKSPEATRKKIERLHLEVVDQTLQSRTTTSIPLPKELPSVEEALKMLAGALKAACKSGLDKVEVQRLQVIATLARTYKDILADYINYREIETKLLDLEAKYAKLLAEKTKGNAPKPDPARVVSSPTE